MRPKYDHPKKSPTNDISFFQSHIFQVKTSFHSPNNDLREGHPLLDSFNITYNLALITTDFDVTKNG